ncbi:3-deoxy-D-manno-octulosonic acid transferase [Aureivirga sp. CE67]|uniref:3-deoxy-D-manno-octulosonic acid transferase n=1 Tax=Aureivirga sp. CE67 TaxID=1788983 RepID=UPI001E4815ED|nr:glycosyltransferase N-terminal domain-containing protein [Aureivirga sp. CE67]
MISNLYNIGVYLTGGVLKTVALFQPKMKLFVEGRKDVFQNLEASIDKEENYVWIHCASLGEFEQGRPVIEKIKANYPNYKIILTFFSPSGYEVRKNYEMADIICYLPLDSKKNAKKFLSLVNPKVAIFVKYEFWPNYLFQLKKMNIPTILVSGIFRKDQVFFKPQGTWMRKALGAFSHFFVQDENSKELLNSIEFENVTRCGDTRFDRVFEITQQDNTLDFIEKFKDEKFTIVAGSSWKDDEEHLVSYINNKMPEDVKMIIAPHNMDKKAIKELEKGIEKRVVLFSDKENKKLEEYQVFIIDTIGILTKIYSYATVAYVGGGFTKSGVHNTLEAATYGLPIVIGPNFKKFNEVKELVNRKACLTYKTQAELDEFFGKLYSDSEFLRKTGALSDVYVKENLGATKAILTYLDRKLSTK